MLIVPILLLTSCATPAGPKSWSGAPRLVGTLQRDGLPMAQTRIRLVHRLSHDGQPADNAEMVETISDADGHFSIGPIGKKSHAAHISWFGLGESAADWGLQIQQGDQWLTGWNSGKGISYAPRTQVVADCDIARQAATGEIAGAGAGTRGSGFCRLSLAPQTKQ